MKIRMSRRYIIFACIAVAIIACIAACLAGNSSQGKCDAVIAYGYQQDDGMDEFYVYSDREHTVLRSQWLRLLMPMGYDRESDTWVFSNGSSAGSDRSCIVLFRGGRKKTIPLQGVPYSYYLYHAVLYGRKVYVPHVSKGELTIKSYNLAGKLEHRQRLHVPNDYIIDDLVEPIAIAKNGLVAATLGLDSTGKTKLFIFDKQGHVKRTLTGMSPQFSADGRQVAYFGGTLVYDDEHGDFWGESGENGDDDNIYILDVNTGKRRKISVWPPACKSPGDTLEAFADFRWDSRRQWLLCAYDRGPYAYFPVFAADLKSDPPKWSKYPIYVNPSSWLLLDGMPKLSY